MTMLLTVPDSASSEKESQSHMTLRESVKKALAHYFTQLGEQTPDDIYSMVLTHIEIPLLKTIMDYTKGNQSMAAIHLGISRGTLRKKLAVYDML